MYSVLNTLLEYTYFYISKKHDSTHFCCLFLKSLKAFSVSLDPIELNYYPFMISLDKRNRGCNVADDLSTKICVPDETKVIVIVNANSNI